MTTVIIFMIRQNVKMNKKINHVEDLMLVGRVPISSLAPNADMNR